MRLVPGEQVDVTVRLAVLSGAIKVPRDAVNAGQNGSYVFVVENGHAVMRDVDGRSIRTRRIAAVKDGRCAPGETVVTDGQLRLTPGADGAACLRARVVNVSAIFIRRPIMTTLLMVAFLFGGLFGYASLPVSELPTIDFPTIMVSASLPGADPDTMATAVATPLENQFTTIPGLDSMSSQSIQGATQITLQFKLDRNIDAAAQDVQSAISAASRQLPPEMPSPPSMRKVNPSEAPILYIALTSKTLPIPTVDEYAETMVVRRLSTLDGVAQVNMLRPAEARGAHSGRSQRARRARHRHRSGRRRSARRQRQPAPPAARRAARARR